MSQDSQLPRRLSATPIAEGNWLRLEKIEYLDREGRSRTWEAVERRRQQGAVVMIAVLRPSNRYVFIQQYRPPVGGLVFEFPAGLIDPDETPERTAVRELYEETGFHGTVSWLSAPTLNTPGMTSEFAHQALMEVDETLPCNRNPTPTPDEGEDIEVFLVEVERVPDVIREREAAGATVDSKVVAYFLGAGARW